MSSETPNGPWLIGGPGRCGKTHLAETLWKHAGPVAGFPLEGLFTVYSKRWLYGSPHMREDLVEEYVTRPRYIDADRKKAKKPIRYFRSSPTQLRESLPANHRHPVAIVGWILDCFASENGRQTWAAFDLHPEFRYTFFRKHIPGVKLAVMVRDPREAIAAALFWRGNPGTGAARDSRFKHSLIMYCLAVRVAQALVRRWPGDVEVFDFNALVSGDARECERISQTFGISTSSVQKAYKLAPHFGFDARKGFLSPEGRWIQLLNDRELSEISALAGAEAFRQTTAARPRSWFLLTARLLLGIGHLSPGFARALADLTHYPRRFAVRRLNVCRQLASDLAQRVSHPLKQREDTG